MRSPKEIRDTEFDVAARGYKTQDVDAFLSIIADELEELMAEKAEMQTKMMMLAEKVEEYRKDEDALRSALISAERMKDSLLQEAEQQKDIVLRDAQQKADKIVEEAQKDIDREEVTLKALRQQVASFKSEILNTYKQHLEVLSDLPDAPEEEYSDETVAQLFTDGEITQATQQPAVEEAAFAFEQAVVEEPQPETAVPTFDAAPQRADGQPIYDGFAPRDWPTESVSPEQPAPQPDFSPEATPEFATFGGDQPQADDQAEKTESRFEKLDFGEDFTFGRD